MLQWLINTDIIHTFWKLNLVQKTRITKQIIHRYFGILALKTIPKTQFFPPNWIALIYAEHVNTKKWNILSKRRFWKKKWIICSKAKHSSYYFQRFFESFGHVSEKYFDTLFTRKHYWFKKSTNWRRYFDEKCGDFWTGDSIFLK